MDWIQRADRFWAAELGVAPPVLRTRGFRVFEQDDTAAQPRATVVATSSVTIVRFPKGEVRAFANAGLDLEQMERSPRRYIAARPSSASLEVRGPAYLGYWPASSAQPSAPGQVELLGGESSASLASLRDSAPEEWDEAGISPDSRVFGLRTEGRLVAVAGYERWSGQLAQLQVFCHPSYRRRGLAAEALKAAIGAALAENLLPQYRARDGNVASAALAKRLGFVDYGWMATVLLRPRTPVS